MGGKTRLSRFTSARASFQLVRKVRPDLQPSYSTIKSQKSVNRPVESDKGNERVGNSPSLEDNLTTSFGLRNFTRPSPSSTLSTGGSTTKSLTVSDFTCLPLATWQRWWPCGMDCPLTCSPGRMPSISKRLV